MLEENVVVTWNFVGNIHSYVWVAERWDVEFKSLECSHEFFKRNPWKIPRLKNQVLSDEILFSPRGHLKVEYSFIIRYFSNQPNKRILIHQKRQIDNTAPPAPIITITKRGTKSARRKERARRPKRSAHAQ